MIFTKYVHFALFLLAACSKSAPDESAYLQALNHFNYIADATGTDPWTAYTSINKPFAGDCEDFAFTLQRQIGGKVWFVVLSEANQPHAVLIKDEWVYDNREQWPITEADYIKRGNTLIYVMSESFNKKKITWINNARAES